MTDKEIMEKALELNRITLESLWADKHALESQVTRLRELCGELWLIVDDMHYEIPATRFHEFEQRLIKEGVAK